MTENTNPFKAALAARERLVGCWLGFADAYVAEAAAGSGFDWLLIDGEHAPNDLRTILDQIRAVETGPSAPVVRPPDGDPARIKQLLDIGARNLLIPMVESGEEAGRLLRATRYPPAGFRGVGYPMARASKFMRDKNYPAQANDSISLILQVESRAGLAALDDIVSVEGIDGIFIGPADLAADMGHLGNPGHPDVRDTVIGALRTISDRGLSGGVLTGDAQSAETYFEAGANFLGVGVDVMLYAQAMTHCAAAFKSNGIGRKG
ncbi:aldolase/citrate lyase family protein [Oricola nitratireducens]|uniref:aldolase/citrate lyase family protein n=1 Tax=Oricola nitratireducens TaxID=2775868 RepID=UPI001865FEF9|nr:HpcH/HpaI aldolase/citrate lyase family protein [Oricola nitratireducens]